MTAKEYLNQAYRLDQRINSKIEQVASLNELATKCTSSLTGMPKAPNQATSTMAEAVTKIVDLQAEINRDIDTLVDLKREIVSVIKQVENLEYQTLLEKRYLCFRSRYGIRPSLALPPPAAGAFRSSGAKSRNTP